jgi:hypothetical protein
MRLQVEYTCISLITAYYKVFFEQVVITQLF